MKAIRLIPQQGAPRTRSSLAPPTADEHGTSLLAMIVAKEQAAQNWQLMPTPVHRTFTCRTIRLPTSAPSQSAWGGGGLVSWLVESATSAEQVGAVLSASAWKVRWVLGKCTERDRCVLCSRQVHGKRQMV